MHNFYELYKGIEPSFSAFEPMSLPLVDVTQP